MMLHVLVGATCNNNCIFCMESDREGRQRHISSQSDDDIRRMIESYEERDEILFTSGEPTTNRMLPTYIMWAREAGFSTIGIITNGRLLSYPAYTRHLLRMGLSKVTISIHGHTARLHDGLTRTPGSFAQTVAGLACLIEARRRRRLDVHTSTVLVRRNLSAVGEIVRFLADLGVDRMCFNVMMAKGRGREHFDRLMPRYLDVAYAFERLVPEMTEAMLERVSIADVPPCMLRGLPPTLYGPQERFDQFEPRGSSGITDRGVETIQRDRGIDSRYRDDLVTHASSIDLEGDREYYMTTRELKDNLQREKGPLCAECVMASSCEGVWARYIARHGWSEFSPILGEPPRALSAKKER